MSNADFMMVAFANPALVGAICPSSRWLAGAMADAAHGAQLLVELGAGTGAITEALVAQYPAVPLVAVELQPGLADLLQLRFPNVDVRCASAHQVLASLSEQASPQTVLVSSLPFQSLPAPWRDRTAAAIASFLRIDARRRLVQYTYRLKAPFEVPADSDLRWTRVGRVWRNAPPANLWSLQRR
jgi:phosphatidylethanolamine/phosphatidyl-N-methylethanolamine N-methyltransferase